LKKRNTESIVGIEDIRNTESIVGIEDIRNIESIEDIADVESTLGIIGGCRKTALFLL
jgi:hypothetical protein